MSPAELFFPTCKDAVRALNQNPAGRPVPYEELYALLVSGGVPGAYQDRRYWRVPVEGLRDIGYEPDTSYALHLTIRPDDVGHEVMSNSAPVDPHVLSKNQIEQVVDEIMDRHEVDPIRKKRLELEHLVLLERENRELHLRLEAAEERAKEADKHLQELRSFLEYATKP